MSPQNCIRMLGLGSLIALAGCDSQRLTSGAPDEGALTSQSLPGTSVFATGFYAPRGLRFGPDGNLYVAEAGLGGTNSTVGECVQFPFPFGPHQGGATARISSVDRDGRRTTVVDGLPSSIESPLVGGNVLGVADVDFLDGSHYALLAGSGCPNGNPGTTNGIIRVRSNGTWTQVTDHAAFLHTHQVAHPDSADLAFDGDPYAMLRTDRGFLVVEANQAQVLKESLDGTVSRVVDLTRLVGNTTPTALAHRQGALLIGNLGNVPFADGSAFVYRLTQRGDFGTLYSGLTAILGLATDARGRLYVLETATGNIPAPPFLLPGTGRVVRIEESGSRTVVAQNLTYPSGITFGPDGRLYIAVCGFGCPSGTGAIVRTSVP